VKVKITKIKGGEYWRARIFQMRPKPNVTVTQRKRSGREGDLNLEERWGKTLCPGLITAGN
jgi:hypothetical protein